MFIEKPNQGNIRPQRGRTIREPFHFYTHANLPGLKNAEQGD